MSTPPTVLTMLAEPEEVHFGEVVDLDAQPFLDRGHELGRPTGGEGRVDLVGAAGARNRT